MISFNNGVLPTLLSVILVMYVLHNWAATTLRPEGTTSCIHRWCEATRSRGETWTQCRTSWSFKDIQAFNEGGEIMRFHWKFMFTQSLFVCYLQSNIPKCNGYSKQRRVCFTVDALAPDSHIHMHEKVLQVWEESTSDRSMEDATSVQRQVNEQWRWWNKVRMRFGHHNKTLTVVARAARGQSLTVSQLREQKLTCGVRLLPAVKVLLTDHRVYLRRCCHVC